MEEYDKDEYAAFGIPENKPPDIGNEEKFPALGSSSANDQEIASLSLDFARALSTAPAPTPSVHATSTTNSARGVKAQGIRKLRSHFGNKWVDTGNSVKVQYKTLRADALEVTKARNECFMKATRAYRSGNKAQATFLSKQGRELNAKMKELHLMAATQIFQLRNPPSQLYEDGLMDLHGLHVAEAIEFLSEILPELASDGLTGIRIVTGTGNHTTIHDGRSRLRPAVQRYLSDQGYEFGEIPDQRGYVGMLMVNLCW